MFIDLFIRYLKTERGYSSHTVRAYKNDIEAFESYVGSVDSTCGLQEVDADVVRMWVSSLMDAGMLSSSVGRKLSSLRTFYSFLCREGYVLSNPAIMITNPKGKKRLPSFLKEGEMDAVLDACRSVADDGFKGVRNMAILACFYDAGLRLSELVGLDMSDVDMELKQLKVCGKGNRHRVIPFVEELIDIFSGYIKERARVVRDDEKAFFVSGNGKRVSRSAVYRLVRDSIAAQTSLAKRSPHVLRHTFATSMLNSGAELMAVKELLGHKRLATTEVYTHMTFEELKRSYKKAHPRAGNN